MVRVLQRVLVMQRITFLIWGRGKILWIITFTKSRHFKDHIVMHAKKISYLYLYASYYLIFSDGKKQNSTLLYISSDLDWHVLKISWRIKCIKKWEQSLVFVSVGPHTFNPMMQFKELNIGNSAEDEMEKITSSNMCRLKIKWY